MSSLTLATLGDLAYCVPIKVMFDSFRNPSMVPARRRDVDSNNIGSQA